LKIHILQKRIEKAARDLQLEIAAMDPQARTRFNENRESLVAELRLLEDLLRTIEGWHLERSRIAIEKMSDAVLPSAKPKEK
jgi:hypothetical protein